MHKQLVLVGGGHAHMLTLANLRQFVARGMGVTVIGPADHHYYSGMGPGMLSRIYAPPQIRFATRHVVEKQGGAFITARVTRIDPQRKIVFCDGGGEVPYDVLSFNAGSYVPEVPTENQTVPLFTAKPIERLLEAQHQLIELSGRTEVHVAMVGGGAAAVELAGNVHRLLSDTAKHAFTVRLFAGHTLLQRFPDKVRAAARRSLERRGIPIVENDKVARIAGSTLFLHSGTTFDTNFIFLATGVRPSPIFAASGLPMGQDGGLAVNEFLQCARYPELFGGGDCISFEPHPLEKVGVYAVRQNPVLYHNLMAMLEKRTLKPFSPGGSYLLIFNMGDGAGILYRNGFLLGGRAAFIIKDLIDRRFMKKFQAIE